MEWARLARKGLSEEVASRSRMCDDIERETFHTREAVSI